MDISALANFGVAGLVLGWFMFRAEERFSRMDDKFDKIEEIMVKTNKAILVLALAMTDKSSVAKGLAEGLLKDLEKGSAK